jgi:threonine/homoserine/homoserine lactone efflux protein
MSQTSAVNVFTQAAAITALNTKTIFFVITFGPNPMFKNARLCVNRHGRINSRIQKRVNLRLN